MTLRRVVIRPLVSRRYVRYGPIHILRQQKDRWVGGDGKMLMFADMVGGWGWQNSDVIFKVGGWGPKKAKKHTDVIYGWSLWVTRKLRGLLVSSHFSTNVYSFSYLFQTFLHWLIPI